LPRSRGSRGISLLELVAVVTLLGVIVAVLVMRLKSVDTDQVKKTACDVERGEIELQVRLWRRSKGTWPSTDLSDIKADPRFFPKGLPVCPVDASPYTIDAATHSVVGHSH
jgi:type II secretory pathway pseudopilin PulG